MAGQTRQDRTLTVQNLHQTALYRTHLPSRHRRLRRNIIHHPHCLPNTQNPAIVDLHQHIGIHEEYFIVDYHLSFTFHI